MLSLHPRSICGEVLGEVSDHVALDRHAGGAPRKARGSGGIDACGVIDEIGVEARGLDLLIIEVARELVNDCAHHFEVPQFLRT